jgi:hypothetical protein
MNEQHQTSTVQAAAKTTDRYIDPAERSWREFITDPDLKVVVVFSLIGLLLALNLMFRFPDFGAVIAQYNQFWRPPWRRASAGLPGAASPKGYATRTLLNRLLGRHFAGKHADIPWQIQLESAFDKAERRGLFLFFLIARRDALSQTRTDCPSPNICSGTTNIGAIPLTILTALRIGRNRYQQANANAD